MTLKSVGCREIGAVVQAKIKAVTHKKECVRRYGTLWKTATVTGKVVQVITPPKGSGKHASVVVDRNLGTYQKRKTLKVGNVELAPVQSAQPGSATDTDSDVEEEEEVSSQGEQIVVSNEEVTPCPDEVVVHEMTWKEGEITSPLNGYVTRKPWRVSLVTGQEIGEHRADYTKTPFDYFTSLFPMFHLPKIVTMTNTNLV